MLMLTCNLNSSTALFTASSCWYNKRARSVIIPAQLARAQVSQHLLLKLETQLPTGGLITQVTKQTSIPKSSMFDSTAASKVSCRSEKESHVGHPAPMRCSLARERVSAAYLCDHWTQGTHVCSDTESNALCVLEPGAIAEQHVSKAEHNTEVKGWHFTLPLLDQFCGKPQSTHSLA
jgi:hypothetical protein